MSDEKFQELMDAIHASKRDLQKDFSDQILKLKSEVTAGQESSSQDVVKKLNKRTYQFKRKGNEAQYAFNTTVEEHIDAARKELGKMNPTGEHEKAVVKKTGDLLKEGMKAIEVRQKHIKIADRSELGWAVVLRTRRMSSRRTRTTRNVSTGPRERPNEWPKEKGRVEATREGRRLSLETQRLHN